VKQALHEGDDYREYMRNQQQGSRASLGDVIGEKLGRNKGRDR
jgi:hypothetical protein